MALFNKVIFFLFLVLSFNTILAASDEAAFFFEKLTPEKKETWSKLLHFEGGKSRIDRAEFFLHPEGATSPHKEFEAFYKKVKNNDQEKYGQLKLPLPCAYPARTQFLKELGVKIEETRCENLLRWLEEVNPSRLSVVFSTSYPNNPGSMFGHTFLRFHNEEKKSDLLDYGANFSALTNEDDPGIVYAWKGLFGGYRGYFDMAPFYIKLNEYIHGENRDLIEYELSLGKDQVHFLLLHLWELYQGAYFDYFFTTENCSYLIAKFIDIARVGFLWTPTRPYYLPSDLIHALMQEEGLVTKITDRASRKRSLETLLAQKADREIETARETIKTRESIEELSLSELELTIALLNFKKYEQREKFEKKDKEFLHHLLLSLSKKETLAQNEEISAFSNRPHLAHGAQKISMGAGVQEGKGYLQLGYQAGYHDLLASDKGVDDFSQFKFLSPLFELFDEKIILRNVETISITSLHNNTFYDSGLSWKIGHRLMRRRFDLEKEEMLSQFEAKMGLARLYKERLMSSLFLGFRNEVGDGFHEWRNELALEGLVLLGVEPLKILLRGEYLFNVKRIYQDIQDSEGEINRFELALGLNYALGRNHEFRVEGNYQKYGKRELEKRGVATYGFYF